MTDHKIWTAIEIACPVCAQQPYEFCVDINGNRVDTHPQRFEDAASLGSKPEDPQLTDEAIIAAVDDLLG